MVIQLQEPDLDRFYRRAKESYFACVTHPENGYLQDEVEVALTALDLREITVKVVFAFRDASTYQVEVVLALYANGEVFGKYECVVDQAGTVTENDLVFY